MLLARELRGATLGLAKEPGAESTPRGTLLQKCVFFLSTDVFNGNKTNCNMIMTVLFSGIVTEMWPWKITRA